MKVWYDQLKAQFEEAKGKTDDIKSEVEKEVSIAIFITLENKSYENALIILDFMNKYRGQKLDDEAKEELALFTYLANDKYESKLYGLLTEGLLRT